MVIKLRKCLQRFKLRINFSSLYMIAIKNITLMRLLEGNKIIYLIERNSKYIRLY